MAVSRSQMIVAANDKLTQHRCDSLRSVCEQSSQTFKVMRTLSRIIKFRLPKRRLANIFIINRRESNQWRSELKSPAFLEIKHGEHWLGLAQNRGFFAGSFVRALARRGTRIDRHID